VSGLVEGCGGRGMVDVCSMSSLCTSERSGERKDGMIMGKERLEKR
jgi:hypothetical protein